MKISSVRLKAAAAGLCLAVFFTLHLIFPASGQAAEKINHPMELTQAGMNARAEGFENVWEYAVSKPGTGAIELLIKEGRDVNEDVQAADVRPAPADRADGWVRRPIHLALEHDRDDILEVLLKAGADPNVKGEYHTPLAEAVWRKRLKSVELLLAYGAKDADKGALSALAEAYRASIDMLKLLLNAGIAITAEVAVDAVTSHGNDAPEKLKLLLACGLDVHRPYTGLVVVKGIRRKSPGVLTVGPDIETKEVSRTLLQWAKLSGSPDIVRVLRDAGAGATREDRVEEIRKVDAGLNRIYIEWLENLDDTAEKNVREEQLAWIRDRDARCKMSYSGGSKDDWLRQAAETETRAACILEATKQRSIQLSRKLFPQVMSPHETVEGRSQAEWSKAYWSWSKSFPQGSEPYKDQSGSLCAQKQSGAVWYLTGGGGRESVVRQCRIPAGRHILLPVLVSLADSDRSDYDICEQMRVQLDGIMNEATDLYVEIDGNAVPNIGLWRQATGCFNIRDGKKNMKAASDGYWLMLNPLAPGRYTIHFGGRLAPDGFSQNVEYLLDIQ